MANSVVKVTETPVNDSLILVIGEDGTVSPDKETVEAYLSARTGETELQIMKVNKSDGKNMDVTVDTLTYIATHNEPDLYSKSPEMEALSRNLSSFLMDHDYTPLTSPRRQSPAAEPPDIDELAQTLSILEGSSSEQQAVTPNISSTSPTKVSKPVTKVTKKVFTINTQKNRIQPTQNTTIFKQPPKTPTRPKLTKPTNEEEEEAEDSYSDEDFALESEESEDDANDSDFELDITPSKKPGKNVPQTRTRIQSEPSIDSPKLIKTLKPIKSFPGKLIMPKIEADVSKGNKTPEVATENKMQDKKPPAKKEKKTPKPIPDDFALFSTPDIIRRVGGKQEYPTTPTTLDSPKTLKPARIFPNPMKSGGERHSLDSKRLSMEGKVGSTEKEGHTMKQFAHRLSLNSDLRSKDKKLGVDAKARRTSVNFKGDKVSMEESSVPSTSSSKVDSRVSLQSVEECSGGGEEMDNQLVAMPSVEDIRAIIQNQDTKTFTTSLVIPEGSDELVEQSGVDQSQLNLDTAALELDQSILDNINSDLISEDILYQVAQSLVDNAELQNAIDKSLVDGNLVLDPSIQQTITHDHGLTMQQPQTALAQAPMEITPPSVKGTQIVRSDGRVVVIPPIERPTTRSRNRKTQPEQPPKPTQAKPVVLDEMHVSGVELDSSSEEDKSGDEDDPDKLWCVCNQPHNNRFMICCDTCEEWYHGKCVNVTKAMGQMMEQEGREWICVYCKDPSLKRPAAAARRVRKASRNSSTDISMTEQKSEGDSTPVSPAPKASTSAVPGCLVCGKPCRNNSIYCSDPCILKHAQVVEKVVVFDRSSGTILSGNNAPSAANLERWLQQNPGFEVVRSTNTNKPIATKPLTQSRLKIVKNPISQGGVSLAVQRKGVNISVLRHTPQTTPNRPLQQKNVLKQNLPSFKIISKQVVTTPRTKLIQPAPLVRNPTIIPAPKPKVIQTTLKPVVTVLQPPKEKPMPQKTPKARQAEEMAPLPKKEENIRDNVKKTLCEQLINRLNLVDNIKLTKEEITKISTEIELQLFRCFGDTGQKYRNKYRSLIFNIKDIKNQTLWRRICERSISAYQLVRLSPDDMASQELALWRERENKHQLEMITKSELEQLGRNRQYVFKTHKGEQELEDDRPKDTVGNTEVITAISAEGSTSPASSSDAKKDTKDKDKKGSKLTRSERDKERKSIKDKSERKDKKKDRGSSSRDRSRRKRSRSKESNRHIERARSRSKDRDRHRRSSHKSSRHKKDTATDKLDKKSKEILEQLVDSKIVPPLEDRLWKHVQQEDITTAPAAESDSDHEPTSTVTIPTPPRSGEVEELQTTPTSSTNLSDSKEENDEDEPPEHKDVLMATTSSTSSVDDDGSKSPPPKTTSHLLWKGTINMVDVAQISITAHEVSGNCSGLRKELPPCLDVVGRISPDTVWDYIGKMKCSNSKVISLVRLNATNVEEKMPYIALYSYLSSRNRLGVVRSYNKAVKDFYILPLPSHKPIPQALLPLNGPGFEESRPALLLGIIVRDKRKRPLFATPPVASKKIKIEVSVPTTPSSSNRSYTPPPYSDPRLKSTLPIAKPEAKDSPEEEPDEDMDEPYSPEDSDPDSMPPTVTDSSKSLNAADLSNLLTGSVKASSFLETGLTTQTFEPFSNKFDSIPGLEESPSVPQSNEELLQKEMEALDQQIARQRAEIQNMSQNIASSSSSDIGTTALASIALPSNLQQILDSINKGVSSPTSADVKQEQSKKEPKTVLISDSDLTMPLVLPKISSRNFSDSAAVSPSPLLSIPLNLPKHKTKYPANASSSNKSSSEHLGESDKTASVLSSLSEEDLIRKAAEMLGETEPPPKRKTSPMEVNYSTKPNYQPTPVIPALVTGHVKYSSSTPNVVPPLLTPKSGKVDTSQPPIPGLED